MAQLAFYKAASGHWWDKIIGWWTKSPYAHVELVLGGPANEALCFSASTREGCTRFKQIDLTDGKWVLVPITAPIDDKAIIAMCRAYVGKRYDWRGIIGFVLPSERDNPDDWFCSEVVSQVLKQLGILPDSVQPAKVSPGKLYDLVTKR